MRPRVGFCGMIGLARVRSFRQPGDFARPLWRLPYGMYYFSDARTLKKGRRNGLRMTEWRSDWRWGAAAGPRRASTRSLTGFDTRSLAHRQSPPGVVASRLLPDARTASSSTTVRILHDLSAAVKFGPGLLWLPGRTRGRRREEYTPMSESQTPLVAWLIQACETRGLSWAEASRRAGLSQGTISAIVARHAAGPRNLQRARRLLRRTAGRCAADGRSHAANTLPGLAAGVGGVSA